MIDPETIGTLSGVFLVVILGAYQAYQANSKAGRLEQRLGQPNGNLHDHRTIRDMLTQLMASVNSLDERLRRHDDRQQESQARIARIENKIDYYHGSDQP